MVTWRKAASKEAVSELKLWILLVYFSILGNYARIGLIVITTYEGSYVRGPTVLWSNLASCFMMGIMQALNRYDYTTPLLSVALTTGFCGSLSSFSSLIMELFEHASRQGISPKISPFPNRAYGVMEFLSVLFVQLMVSMCSHLFGLFLTTSVIEGFEHPEGTEALDVKVRARKISGGFEKLAFMLAIPLLIVQVVLAAVFSNSSRRWTLSASFAFPGTALRYILSKTLNSKVKNFPLGTFAANVLGTLLLSIFTIFSRGRASSGVPLIESATSVTVLEALQSGFCGCLSTISTFINEGHVLPIKKMLIYYFSSISVSFALVIITLGSYAWTRGIN